MLIKDVKTVIEGKLAGTRPTPSDEQLSFDVLEALQYVASTTTPRVLLRNTETDVQESTFRVIEECSYITIPDKPVFDVADKDYSEVRHLNMDEDLVYAVIYYALHVIMKGNEPTQTGGNKLTFKQQADSVISVYQSNFTRAGGILYELL